MWLEKWQFSECEKLEGRKQSFGIEDECCLGLGFAWWGSELIPVLLGVHPSLVLWGGTDGHPEEAVPQAWNLCLSREPGAGNPLAHANSVLLSFSFWCPDTAVTYVSEVVINVPVSTRDLFKGSGWFCCLKFLSMGKNMYF